MSFLKSVKIFIAILFAGIILSSCSFIGPVCATSNPVGQKVGMQSASVIFGLAFNADASIRKAAQNGNIKLISTVDMKVENYFGIVMIYTTIVTGE